MMSKYLEKSATDVERAVMTICDPILSESVPFERCMSNVDTTRSRKYFSTCMPEGSALNHGPNERERCLHNVNPQSLPQAPVPNLSPIQYDRQSEPRSPHEVAQIPRYGAPPVFLPHNSQLKPVRKFMSRHECCDAANKSSGEQEERSYEPLPNGREGEGREDDGPRHREMDEDTHDYNRKWHHANQSARPQSER